MTSRRSFLKTAALASTASVVVPRRAWSATRTLRPGDFMMVDLPTADLTADTVAFLREYGVRGVCLFQRHIQSEAQTRGLVESLRAALGPDVLVAIDQEGGGVLRTRTLPFAPSAMSLGAGDDPAMAEAVGAAVGRGLRSMGFNWDFAPVLDVNNNPGNPVIGDRSFGADPALVERMGLAWMRGLSTAGVAGCVKHFPGHGDTHVDSHHGLPVVDKPLATLEALEFAPFRAAARAGAPAFMTAHIVFPALDPEHPATLSRPILTGLLRERYGYEGVITTDSMGMQAVSDRYGRGDAARMTLAAGADLVLALGNREAQTATAESIAAVLRDTSIPASEMRRKAERLTALARRFPVHTTPYGAAERQSDGETMRRAWAAGLTTVGDARPITPRAPITVVVSQGAPGGSASDSGLSGQGLTARLAERYDVRLVTFDGSADTQEAAERDFAAFHRPGTPVVFASTSRLRLTPSVKAFAARVQPSLHLALWNPYNVADVPAPALVTYGFRPEALDAALAWMTGQAQAPGRLPVEMPR